MKGEEITTYQQIVAFCKRRTTHLKYKALSKAAERSPGARHMNAIQPNGCDVPLAPTYSQAQLDQINAAVKVGGAPRTNSPRGRSPGAGGTAQGKGRAPGYSFPNDQCMECSSKNHRRANCPVYKKVLEANGGQRPAGHMGDFEKAHKACQEKNGKPRSKSPARGDGKGGNFRTHVKGLMDEHNEDVGNVCDSSASSCGSGAHMKAMVASG